MLIYHSLTLKTVIITFLVDLERIVHLIPRCGMKAIMNCFGIDGNCYTISFSSIQLGDVRGWGEISRFFFANTGIRLFFLGYFVHPSYRIYFLNLNLNVGSTLVLAQISFIYLLGVYIRVHIKIT